MSAVLNPDLNINSEEISRHVVLVDATTNQGVYDKKFERAFVHMIENPDDKGLISTHLFYDIPRARSTTFSQLSYDARSILSGGHAWERRVEEAIQGQDQAGFWSKDQSVTAHAIKHGLMDKLPKGFIKFVSYGGGDIHAFSGNELQIIEATFNERKEDIVEFCAVDILERFAFNCAIATRNAYGIKSRGVLGDFIYNGHLAIPDTKGTPVIMIFGGPFENTPFIKNGPSPIDISALAWAKMNIQHGLGSVVIKTFDTNQSPDLKNGPYAPRKNFEAFLLSAFARATQQGVINDPQYDVFEHWKITSEFNQDLKSIELAATCKIDHDIMIANKLRSFAKDEKRVITLSHKWDEATQISIAQRAGFDVEIYREPGNTNLLMVAQAVRKPNADLQKLLAPR
ncbi:MAG: L-histidine N(alpha)-methyltransferase [Pseudomonadota bacterium]